MSKQSIIVRLGLESRARALSQNPDESLVSIAKTLSSESGSRITKDIVFKFLKTDEKTIAETIEKKAKLASKITEAEISTIENRETVIKGLLELASKAIEDRDRVLAFKEANIALDSLDKRIGKLANNPNVQINNMNSLKITDITTLTDEQLMAIINSE